MHFAAQGGELLAELRDVAAAQSGTRIDHRVPLDEASRRLGGTTPVQGNIDPAMLAAPWEVLAAHVRDVLRRGEAAPAHVVNLGHGVPPSADPGVLSAIVRLVHEGARCARARPCDRGRRSSCRGWRRRPDRRAGPGQGGPRHGAGRRGPGRRLRVPRRASTACPTASCWTAGPSRSRPAPRPSPICSPTWAWAATSCCRSAWAPGCEPRPVRSRFPPPGCWASPWALGARRDPRDRPGGLGQGLARPPAARPRGRRHGPDERR